MCLRILRQTSENGEKPNFGSNFGPFDLNLSPQIFFVVLTLLDVRPGPEKLGFLVHESP